MRQARASIGPLMALWPWLQILTIRQLLEGAKIDYPPQYACADVTFKKAPKAKGAGPIQKGLPIAAETEKPYGD